MATFNRRLTLLSNSHVALQLPCLDSFLESRVLRRKFHRSLTGRSTVIYSLGQDLVYCVSHGRIKTPKHVLLRTTVKSLTGNAEMMTLLNRFGHGMSYSQVEELETALAEQQADKQKDGNVLPSVCKPNIPRVFCWDNNDLQEETSGTDCLIAPY